MNVNKKAIHNISKFEDTINYTFKNKSYILEALTHSSYSNENKNYKFNERLEFLGDSVLSIVISDYLFKKEKNLPEGELTKLRANIVCEESLSEVAGQIHLGEYLLLGKGEEATGGRDRISILADALEFNTSEVYDLIFIDGGLEEASKFIFRFMEEIIENSIEVKIFRDYKTYLQEVLQSKGEQHIWYKLIEEKGPDHNKRFVMEVGINDKVLGVGEGKSKKDAEQVAAKCALDKKM